MRRERELKDLANKLDQTQQQLDDLKRRGMTSNEELLIYKEREATWEIERRSLQVGCQK